MKTVKYYQEWLLTTTCQLNMCVECNSSKIYYDIRIHSAYCKECGTILHESTK